MDKIIPNFKLFLALFFICILLFIFDLTHLLSLPKNLAFYITNPISFGLFQTNKNIAKQFNFILEARLSAQQNTALKEQISQMLSENAKLRRDLAESQSMLSQEKYLDPQTYNQIPARPIGLGRYLKIDKGSSDGVRVGEAVVFNENLVGKIVNVSDRASNVQLLTDPDSKVAAFSQGLEGKSKGILLGHFGTDMILDKILHEEKITEDDLVYSEGTEGYLPRGLILGRVTSVLEHANEPFKQAKIKSVFDIRDLELVFVLEE